MYSPPACSGLGPQCRHLSVTLRIGTLEEGPESLDHEATWLLGHTDRITFRQLRAAGGDLVVDADLHVRCRYLKPVSGPEAEPTARCAAHGHTGPMPEPTRGAAALRRLGGDRFVIVQNQSLQARELRFPARSLPVMAGENPCAAAPCTTAEHTRGSACCRDLQVEILCGREDTEREALVRSRQSPYLCKVSREADDALEAEMISACDYLDDAGRNCTLHGRQRGDGRPAKPDLCSEWPPKGKGLHPGCIFRPTRGKA
jgi:hypothetical protein